jgi:hypothetical protein
MIPGIFLSTNTRNPSSGGSPEPPDPPLIPNFVTSRASAGIPFTNVANDWQGRMVFAHLADGTWFAVWKEGVDHSDYNGATSITNGCFFSADFSVRSDNNKDFDGNPIVGFPLDATLVTADTGFVDYNIIRCPNGDTVLWAQNRGVNGEVWNGVNFAIHQYRSTAAQGCKTWQYEFNVCVELGYTTNLQQARLQAFYENYVTGNTILIPMCEIPSVITNTRVRMVVSTDNMMTLAFKPDITSLGEGVGSTNETGINGVGNAIKVVIRTETSDFSVSYKRESSDLGETWGPLVDITDALGYCAVHQPHLVRLGDYYFLFGRQMASFTGGPFRKNGVWRTPISNFFDPAQTTRYALDPFYTGNGATDITTGDAGYTKGLLNPDGESFTCFGYYGQAQAATIYKYEMSFSETPSTEIFANNEFRVKNYLTGAGIRISPTREGFYASGLPGSLTPPVNGGQAIISRPYNFLATGNDFFTVGGTAPEFFVDSNGKGCAYFNGSSRMIIDANLQNTFFRAAFFIMVKIRPADGRPSATQVIFRASNVETTTTTDLVLLQYASTGIPLARYAANAVLATFQPANPIFDDGPDNPAHTLIMTVHPTDGVKLYDNNVELTSNGVDTGAMGSVDMLNFSSALPMYVGQRQASSTPTFDLGFVGWLYELIIGPGIPSSTDRANLQLL